MAAQAEASRSAESGVNLDEEAARLIQYQQSYQAAAKILQIAQTVFDTLLDTAGLNTDPCASPPPTPSTAAVDNLQQRQQDLQLAQDRLTSGKRVARASDDPAAAARVERALATSARAVADQRGLEASRSAMQQVEGALGDATEAMQQVRELLVAAGNGSYTDAERANLGARIARPARAAVLHRQPRRRRGRLPVRRPGFGAAALRRRRGRRGLPRRRRPDRGAGRRPAADDARRRRRLAAARAAATACS